MAKKKKLICSATSIAKLQKMLNEYNYSTGYVINPGTLKVGNAILESHGRDVTKNWEVQRKFGGYYCYWIGSKVLL